MTFNRKKTIVSIIFNGLIVIMEIISLIMGFLLRWNEYKLKAFLFYTQDSNLFALIACSVMTFSQIRCLSKKQITAPKYACRMKYMAACALSLTFLVVLFILIPLAGFDSFSDKLFADTKLYHHFLCPILTVISFLYFEDYHDLTLKDATYAIIPTFTYALIMIMLNILHIIDGPYPYLRVYNQPIYMSIFWCFFILIGAYVIAMVLLYLNQKIMKGEKE